MDAIVKLLEAVSKIIEKLTTSRVVLLIVLIFGGIVMSFVYENRHTIVPRLFDSPVMLISSATGIIVFLLGWVFSVLLTRAEKTNAELTESLKQQIDKLNSTLGDYREREAEYLRYVREKSRNEDETL